MSRLDEIFQTLHDVILERFRAQRGGDATDAQVAFEFGTPIPDDTFRLRDDNQTLSQELAIEFLSQHANTVPEVKDGLFRRRPYTVEGQYGLLLAGATAVDAAAMEMLGGVKRQAVSAFDTTLGSLAGPYRYRPVYATPVNWYDETEAENWTHISVKRSDTPPAPARSLHLDPRLKMWRVAPQTLRPALAAKVSAAAIRQLEAPIASTPVTAVKPPRAEVAALRVADTRARMRMPVAGGGPVTLGKRRRRSVDIARTAGIGGRLRDASRFREAARVEQPAPPPAPAAGARTKVGSLLAVDASLLLAKAIEADSKQQPIVTDTFGIDVDMCVVTLNRPWLSDSLLTLPGWFVPGYQQGEFSDGDGEEDGPFASLPTACILIRDLHITATWSDADAAVIEQSANLGSFSLMGRSFDRNSATITVPGMQSIAWVVEPMRVLPPASAPAIG